MTKFRLLSFFASLFLLTPIISGGQTYFNESFNGSSFPPTGWSTYVWYASGSDGGGCGCTDWQYATSYGGVEPLEPTHTGSGMAWYNSWDMYWDNESSLISPAEDLTQYTCGTNYVDFWMIRSFDYYWGGYEDDWIDVYAYDPSYGYYWLTELYDGGYNYPSVSSDGWYEYNFALPAFFNSYSNVSIVFDAFSEYAVDMYIDDVKFYHVPGPPSVSVSSPICTGNSFTLTASSPSTCAPSPTYSWTGPGGFTATGSSVTRTGATTAMSGTYTCKVTSGGYTSNGASITVSVKQTPDVTSVTGTTPACIGSTLTLGVTSTSAAPATTSYSWTGPGGYTSTTQNPSLSPVTAGMAGTYNVTATSSVGCSSSGSVNITVNPTPSFSISTTDPTSCTCNCGYITLSGLNASTSYGFNYSKNGTPVGATTVTTDASGNYTITGLGSGLYDNITLTLNGCTSVPGGPVTLNDPGAPSAPTVTSNSPVCQGFTLNFNGSTSTTGLTWTWSGPNGFNVTATGTSSNPSRTSVPVIDSGNYYTYLTDANGCNSPTTITNVVIKASPNAPSSLATNAPNPTGICAGNTLTITGGTTTPPGSPATIGYSFTDPAGGAWTTPAGTATLTIPNASANLAGTWIVYSTLNGCSSVNPLTIYTLIKPIPGVPNLNSNTPVCAGQGYNANKLILTVSDTTPAPTFVWSGPNAFSASGTATTQTITNPTAAAAGTYTAYASKNGCNSASVTTNVTINPTPGKPTGSKLVSYCQYDNSAVPLIATGTSLMWYTASTGGVGTSITPIPSTSVAGLFIWYVTQTNTFGCESQPVSDSVLVKTKPTVPLATQPPPYCQGSYIPTLSAIGANLLWYTTATGGVGSAIAPTPSSAVAGTTTYYVTQTVNGCESDRLAINVTVNPKPGKPSVVSPVQYCQGDVALPLSAGGSNLLWYLGSSGGVGSPVQPVPLTTYADTVYYYVTQTNSFGCESDRSQIAVVTNYTPNALIVANQPYVCQYDSMFFTYFGNATSSAIFNWTMPIGATMLHGNPQGPIWIKFDSAGTRIVKLQVTNGKCKSPLTSYAVEVRLAPLVPTNIKDQVCQGQVLNVSLGYSNENIDKYDWNFDGANIVYGSSGSGPYGIVWNTSGLHVVKLIAYTNSCPSIPVLDSVTVHPIADAHIGDVGSGGNICAGDSVSFTAERYNPAYLYQWLPANYFGTQTNSGTVYGYIEHTGYITLQVTTEFGCTSQDSTLITAQPCCEVYMPNAFTPNGDGKNDVFHFVSRGNQVLKTFRITNRWGQVVFETVNPRVGWDGKYNGVVQDMGTYFYYIEYVCANGKTYQQKGEILLIK